MLQDTSLFTLYGMVFYGVQSYRPDLAVWQIKNAIAAYAEQPEPKQAGLEWDRAAEAVLSAVIVLNVRDLANEMYKVAEDAKPS